MRYNHKQMATEYFGVVLLGPSFAGTLNVPLYGAKLFTEVHYHQAACESVL